MNPKDVGERSEAMLLAALLCSGEIVLIPFGDNQRYDLVLDRAGTFHRVQVKTGRLRNGAVIFNACSSTAHRRNGGTRDYRGQADFFGVYCPVTHSCYLVPVKEVGTRMGSLRIDQPKRCGQIVRWAADFEITSPA